MFLVATFSGGDVDKFYIYYQQLIQFLNMPFNFQIILDFLEKTPWFQQLASIFAIIGAPSIVSIVLKTRHKIFFEPKETYHERRLVDRADRPRSFWLHLMVKNKGYKTSKSAEGYISEIWIKKENKIWANTYSKLEEFMSPVKLKWAHELEIHPIDILPKQPRRLDVCFIVQNEPILHLVAKGFASGTIKNKLAPGNYIFMIKVVSDNSLRPTTFPFSVIWDGKWKTLQGNKYIKNFRFYGNPIKSFSRY